MSHFDLPKSPAEIIIRVRRGEEIVYYAFKSHYSQLSFDGPERDSNFSPTFDYVQATSFDRFQLTGRLLGDIVCASTMDEATRKTESQALPSVKQLEGP